MLTIRDWADPKAYLHDLISRDRRSPTVNAYGPVYGTTELSVDYMPVLDPVRPVTSQIELTVRDPETPPAASPAMLRVPYPMGYSAKWLEGRIDDPNAGWKGRGLWATYAGRGP